MRGRRLSDRYVLIELLGSGGMGEVWRATDERLGRDVAVKLLLPERAQSPDQEELVARFRREARVAAALDSPYVAAVHDHGVDEGSPYLVMTLVEGRTLSEVLRERGRVCVDDALRWTADVCRGLAAAHEAGIVHRDIKPANIMVTGEGPESVAKVVDFGIARFTEARATDPDLTRTGQLPFGSVLYMAPERFRQEPGDGRTDLYAVGCVLYELLVGRPPFVGDAAGVMYNHLHDEPLRPSRARAELGPDIDRLILGLMAKEVGGRPADAGAVVGRIEAMAARTAGEEAAGPAPEDAVPVSEGAVPVSKAAVPPPPSPAVAKAPAPASAPVPTRDRPRVPRVPRRTLLAALAALLVVGVPVGIGIGSDSEGSGTDDAGAAGAAGAAPAPAAKGPEGGYSIGVAYDWGDDEKGRIPKVRKRIVEAALEEAERRSGKKLPVRVVPVEDYQDTPAEELLTQQPGMLALVGAIGDYSDYREQMAVVDTCDGGWADPTAEFNTVADDATVGKAAGRYLTGAYGVRKVLIGDDNYWQDEGKERPVLGYGLRAAGVKALATDSDPGDLETYEIDRDVAKRRPDAVVLRDLRTGPEESWAPDLRRQGTFLAVHDAYASACDVLDEREMYAKHDRQLPDGTVRFRSYRDEGQKPDCEEFPGLCPKSPELKELLKERGAAELYDATLLVAQGLAGKLGPKPDADRARADLRAALSRQKVDGLLGSYAFKSNQAVDRPVWVDRRVKGRWQQLGTVDELTG
ncbi:bifunctional serine/threonine-protein kinase/ABC transporter substrate-binding protein [Streptomyces sp. NPDC050658]|uniref:bifunctional serine/threonine-protein kinase/ABC transporter substrate-binding protein n=1 Tax=unclassified Streptomyces TaxID=2593676 RepID=UPI00343160E4